MKRFIIGLCIYSFLYLFIFVLVDNWRFDSDAQTIRLQISPQKPTRKWELNASVSAAPRVL